MKLPPLRYLRPASLAEAQQMILDQTLGAQLLAGGQSLIPALALGERQLQVLVDIGTLPPLRAIDVEGSVVRIGAAVPLREIEFRADLRRQLPLLHRAITTVGAMAVRSRCSLGGSLGWGDPNSQLPAALAASSASIHTTERQLPVAEFLGIHPAHRLMPGEIIIEIEIPTAQQAGVGLAHVRRTHITWPVAGAVAMVDRSGTRIGLYGAGPIHIAVHASADADAVDTAISLIQDLHDRRAAASYRRQVLPTLARRAVAQARKEFNG